MNNRCPFASMAKWSKRPLTPGRSIVAVNRSAARSAACDPNAVTRSRDAESVFIADGSLAAVAEIVEQRDAVGFRPHAHFAGIGETVIRGFDDFPTIERHAELVPREIDAKGVPHAGRDPGVRV